MSKLLNSLSQRIQRQITERGLVLWYDPEKACHVASQVEEGLLGFKDVEQMAEEAGSMPEVTQQLASDDFWNLVAKLATCLFRVFRAFRG